MEENRSRDEELYAFSEGIIENLLKSKTPHEHILSVLISLAVSNKVDRNEYQLKERINLVHLDLLNDNGYRKEGRNIQQEVLDLIHSRGSGTFSLNDAYNDLQLKTKEERTAGRVAIKRLCDYKRIEKENAGRTGLYRIVDKSVEVIDIMGASTEALDIKLPLGVHEFVKILPGIIIISGESNAGKTAYCLNIARANKVSHRINYLTSEGQDGAELKIRLEEFKVPLEWWKEVRFIFRTDSFPDVIEPDSLNIVDYLDEGSDGEAYKMVGRIRDIANKIKNGLAVIAIQKHSGKAYGFGGEGTLNRSRLYMSITREGILKIEKAKIWKQGNVNPNGLFIKFKLAAGCKFSKDGEWSK